MNLPSHAFEIEQVRRRLEAGNGGYEIVHASPGLEVTDVQARAHDLVLGPERPPEVQCAPEVVVDRRADKRCPPVRRREQADLDARRIAPGADAAVVAVNTDRRL